jgi:hypothetical protein
MRTARAANSDETAFVMLIALECGNGGDPEMADESPKRIDHFNTIVGLIFAQLYENFPVPTGLDEGAIADAMGVEKSVPPGVDSSRKLYNFGALPSGDNFYSILNASRQWLRDEGFIRAGGEWATVDLVLTSKALAVMSSTPAGVSSDKPGGTLGSQIVGAAKGAGKTASNAAIGDLVGQVIGGVAGVAKGLFL